VARRSFRVGVPLAGGREVATPVVVHLEGLVDVEEDVGVVCRTGWRCLGTEER
jgi:hypothetical protein